MTRLRLIFATAVAALAGALIPAQQPAKAAFGQFLCSPTNDVVGSGARTIGGSTSSVPSGTLYVLNGQGCGFIAQQDVGYFQSLGFTGGQNFFTVSLTALTANSTTSNSPSIPPGTYIHNIVIQETAGHAITGGVDIGTTAGATDIVSAVACGASCLIAITDSALSKRLFSTTAAQQIFFTCHSACNSGSLNISILYSYF